MKPSNSSIEARALAFAQANGGSAFASGELRKGLGLTAAQERKILHRLHRNGLIVRIRRGLYLFPKALPLARPWNPGVHLVISELFAACGGRYQICGPNAFHRYGWTDQVPNRVYIYNNRISGDRRVGMAAMTLIKVADERLGSIERTGTPEGVDLIYASRVRSLVDSVYDWSRFGTLPQAYSWIQAEIARDPATSASLVLCAIRYGNMATLRRIGALAERIGMPHHLLRKLELRLKPTTSFIPWVPGRQKRGRISRRWGVVLND